MKSAAHLPLPLSKLLHKSSNGSFFSEFPQRLLSDHQQHNKGRIARKRKTAASLKKASTKLRQPESGESSVSVKKRVKIGTLILVEVPVAVNNITDWDTNPNAAVGKLKGHQLVHIRSFSAPPKPANSSDLPRKVEKQELTFNDDADRFNILQYQELRHQLNWRSVCK